MATARRSGRRCLPTVKVFRAPENPILTPSDIPPSAQDMEVVCAFNAGVARLDGEVILMIRVAERPLAAEPEYVLLPTCDTTVDPPVCRITRLKRDTPGLDLGDPRKVTYNGELLLTSLSHLRVARSRDGRRFEVETKPAVTSTTVYESFGVEDARITPIDGVYYVNYTAVSQYGIATALASTTDFRSFKKYGIIFCPENRDVTIFPERLDGRCAALHRPVPAGIGRPDIWLAYSPDLLHWGDHRRVMGPRPGMWDSAKLGGGAIPIKTEHGWLCIYHGVDEGTRYSLGAVLLDLKTPEKVLGRSREPILMPEMDYEVTGFFGNVVFTCGALESGGMIDVYYGAADTVMALARVSVEDVLKGLE